MINQFNDGVRTKDLIDVLKPKLIMELGFGAGGNVLMLLAYSIMSGLNYKLISLSDQASCLFPVLPGEFAINYMYINGISYKRLPQIRDLGIPNEFNQPVDFMIVDTDHNYYTLKRELEAIDPLMSQKCAIAFHDTASKPCKHHAAYKEVTNAKSNAMFKPHGYDDGTEYPIEGIFDSFETPMMTAIDEFLEEHKDYKKIKHIEECCGCTVLARDFNYV